MCENSPEESEEFALAWLCALLWATFTLCLSMLLCCACISARASVCVMFVGFWVVSGTGWLAERQNVNISLAMCLTYFIQFISSLCIVYRRESNTHQLTHDLSNTLFSKSLTHSHSFLLYEHRTCVACVRFLCARVCVACARYDCSARRLLATIRATLHHLSECWCAAQGQSTLTVFCHVITRDFVLSGHVTRTRVWPFIGALCRCQWCCWARDSGVRADGPGRTLSGRLCA